MGKRGPCFHCGIENTPLWRNGPPEKPVLCNACGSRYRLRGSLDNYFPKHSQVRRGRPRTHPLKIPLLKPNSRTEKSNAYYSTGSEDYASSECSDISFPIKQEEVEDANENPGDQNLTSLWRNPIPSKKRTMVEYISLTPIETLQKDLCRILRYEGPSIDLSESKDDVLIYNVNNQNISSNEIGHGSILLKLPSSSTDHQERDACSSKSILLKLPSSSTEQEREACSSKVDNKNTGLNDAQVGSLSMCCHIGREANNATGGHVLAKETRNVEDTPVRMKKGCESETMPIVVADDDVTHP